MSASISIGAQLIAPSGFMQLETEITYYFFRSLQIHGRKALTYLIYFDENKSRTQKNLQNKNNHFSIKPRLITTLREDFERGIDLQKIVKKETQSHLPYWLSGMEDRHPSSGSNANKISHEERIDQKLKIIGPLLERLDELLKSPNIERQINQYARSCKPAQNETRVRLWFFTYLLFNQNRYALHYSIGKQGIWDRQAHASKIKRGRPSWRGKDAGFNADTKMVEKIINSYSRISKLGINLREIYQAAITEDFHCTVTGVVSSPMRFISKNEEPYPTFDMYSYYVHQNFGQSQIYHDKYGSKLSRDKFDVDKGSFSSLLINILERAEGDAYHVKALPRGLIEGSTLPGLVVATIIDVTTFAEVGIGFSFGSETSAAYRMALFCAAISKSAFFRIWGMDEDPATWPTQGLPKYFTTDRGPGSAKEAYGRAHDLEPIFKEITPSGSPRSKPSIETSNPKTPKNRESPSYIQSDLFPGELCIREIYRLLKNNNSVNISDRIPSDLLEHIEIPTPIALYKELARRGRNDSRDVSFADAVRQYLTKSRATLQKDGVHFHGLIYNSEEFRVSGLLNRNGHLSHKKLEIYVYDMALRYVWVDVRGKLIELAMMTRLTTAEGDLYLSLEELLQRESVIKKMNLEAQEHRHAVAAHYKLQFDKTTGKKWDAQKRVTGRPKRGTTVAKREANEAAVLANVKGRQ
jgi:hypothetical protein